MTTAEAKQHLDNLQRERDKYQYKYTETKILLYRILSGNFTETLSDKELLDIKFARVVLNKDTVTMYLENNPITYKA
jgi:hypothetical protein